jgi:hypothetical protein
VVTAVGAVPLVLLLVPAARRPRRTARAAPDQPPGWRRPFAGWGQFAFMLVGGGLLTARGLVLALTGRGADRGAGATIALFFLACLLAAPLPAPGRRRGRLRLGAVRLGERQERGILVPYSGWRTALLLGVIACLALATLGFVVFAGALADDPGQSPLPVRLLGVVGVVLFGLGGLVFAYRGRGRRWRVLLTPSAVVIAAGGARTVVPWEAIQQVRATEVTTRVRGIAVSEPLVGIDLSDPQAIQTGRLERLLLPWSRRLGADLTLPIRTLGIDPPLLYQAVRYYHQHPRPTPSSRPLPGWPASSTASSPRPSQPVTGTASTPRPVVDTGQPWDVSPGMLAILQARGPAVPVRRDAGRASAMGRPGSPAARTNRRPRRHRAAGEFGRIPRPRLTAAIMGPGAPPGAVAC